MVPASGLGSTSNIQELISEIDQDGNGEISFNEFVWLMTRYLHNSMILLVHNKRVFQRDLHDDEIEDEIREAFRCFDKEGHGFIPVTGTVIRLAIFKLSTKFY